VSFTDMAISRPAFMKFFPDTCPDRPGIILTTRADVTIKGK